MKFFSDKKIFTDVIMFRFFSFLYKIKFVHRAQVHIRGYRVVHTGDAEFEARKRRKVDLITSSFDMVIKIKVVKFVLFLVSHLVIRFRSA